MIPTGFSGIPRRRNYGRSGRRARMSLPRPGEPLTWRGASSCFRASAPWCSPVGDPAAGLVKGLIAHGNRWKRLRGAGPVPATDGRPPAGRVQTVAPYVQSCRCRLLQPTILMPAALPAGLSAEKLWTVLIHELAHVAGRPLGQWSPDGPSSCLLLQSAGLAGEHNGARVREQAVDEMVLVALRAEARSYGQYADRHCGKWLSCG